MSYKKGHKQSNTGRTHFKRGHKGYWLGKKRPSYSKYTFNPETCTYRQLHRWVIKVLGTPRKCEHCGTTESKFYDWANKSGKYLVELSDWIRLCRKCHVIYDCRKSKDLTPARKKRTSVLYKTLGRRSL